MKIISLLNHTSIHILNYTSIHIHTHIKLYIHTYTHTYIQTSSALNHTSIHIHTHIYIDIISIIIDIITTILFKNCTCGRRRLSHPWPANTHTERERGGRGLRGGRELSQVQKVQFGFRSRRVQFGFTHVHACQLPVHCYLKVCMIMIYENARVCICTHMNTLIQTPAGFSQGVQLGCTHLDACQIPVHSYLKVYLSIYLSIELYMYPSIYLSIHPSIHLPIHPSIYRVYAPECMSNTSALLSESLRARRAPSHR